MSDTLAYQQGKFDYNDCFSGIGGFLSPGGNEEKHLMALYLRVFAESLAQQGVLFGQNKQIRWLEPGVGDGSSTEKMLRILLPVHPAGFKLHLSDVDKNFLQKAQSRLSSLSGAIELTELRNIDAFSKQAIASPESCNIAMLAHFVYHASNNLNVMFSKSSQIKQKIEYLIDNILEGLDEQGIIIAFHEKPFSSLQGKIARRYGAGMNETMVYLAEAANKRGKPVFDINLDAKFYFPPLSDKELNDLKNLENWGKYANDTPQASWIKKFLFCLQAPEEKDAQGNIVYESGALGLFQKGLLSEAIDFVKNLCRKDEFGSYIMFHAPMQIILKNDALTPVVQNALLTIKQQLPQLHHELKMILENERR